MSLHIQLTDDCAKIPRVIILVTFSPSADRDASRHEVHVWKFSST